MDLTVKDHVLKVDVKTIGHCDRGCCAYLHTTINCCAPLPGFEHVTIKKVRTAIRAAEEAH